MNTQAFGAAGARPVEAEGGPEGASPWCSATREQPPGQGERTSDVVRVTAADVLTPPEFRPPTAQTLEELGIPASYRQAVEKELTRDEQMLWVGRPSRNPEVHPRNPMLQWIGIGMLVFAVALVLLNLLLAGGEVFGFVFAGALGVIGLAFLIPSFVSPATTCRYCYVVTNRRALLVEISLWQRGPVARSYLPQQLVGLERRDHATVAGAGDLIFQYEFIIPGNTLNPLTGSLIQQSSTGGLSNSPQRVPRGFMCLDQAREVEALIRTTLLGQLEQALDAPKADDDGNAHENPAQAVSVACACGVTIQAPPALTGRRVKCPRCAAAVALDPREADAADPAAPISCQEDGSVPADLKAKTLAGLDPKEKPLWIGQPDAKLVLVRSGGYLAVGGVGILAALIWLVIALAPPRAAGARLQPGKQAATAAAKPQASSLLFPAGLFVVSACVSAVALVRWKNATRTCYALTNRRALVYKESLFGPTRDSYSPLEVAGMRRSDSWLFAGTGDLIFRTVQVVSTSGNRTGPWRTSVKTIHYGFLAVPQLGAVEKLVRETLIDRFVDKLNQASAL
jgi:hypothetical protein